MRLLKDRIEYLSELKGMLMPNPMCMEIGVHVGSFSKGIFDSLSPKELHLIDPFENMIDPISQKEYYSFIDNKTVYSDQNCLDIVESIFEDEIANKKVFIDKSLSTNALKNYEDNTFDFIYIDACHLYESALWDMENYIHKVKKGGYLGGHDYYPNPSFGVMQAVDEFCEKYGYELILLVDKSQCGDWLLSPKK